MREILFRGKDIKDKWHIGLLAHIGNAWYISNEAGTATAFEVNPITIGQYTGLNDHIGTKIFEHDIVDYQDEYGVIQFDKETARFIVHFDSWVTDFDHIYPHELEVVGNFHDTPELVI